jgi:hypothetical protein
MTNTSATDIAFESLCSKLRMSATTIAKHSKMLADLVNDTGPTEELEKVVIQAARAAAKETATLVDLINSAPPTTSEAKRLQLNILKNAGRDCSNAVLALIGMFTKECHVLWLTLATGSTKKAISNPFDFMTKQDVGNKCKEVAVAIKGVLEANDALRELCKTKITSSAQAAAREEGLAFASFPPPLLTSDSLGDTANQKANEKLLQETKMIAEEARISLQRYVMSIGVAFSHLATDSKWL